MVSLLVAALVVVVRSIRNIEITLTIKAGQ